MSTETPRSSRFISRCLGTVALSTLVTLTAGCGGGGGGGSGDGGSSSGGNPSNQARFLFDCDLNGQTAQMTMDIEAVAGGGVTWGPGPNPDITGVIGTGSYTFYTAGEVISNTAYYTFTGENQFADFVDHTYNERFRVQWQEVPNGLNMIVNPFGPGPATHYCQLTDSYYL